MDMEPYMIKRKPRSVNWLKIDRKLLTVLACKHIEIIENKSTDKHTNAKKQATWEAIAQRFNTLSRGGARTADQARIQWRQMKLITKKENPTFYNQIKNRCITNLPQTYKNAQALADGVDNGLGAESKGDSSSEDEATLSSLALAKPQVRSFYLDIHDCCVALIQDHGRPADLLDDKAFKKILSMIPMTESERSKLTSTFIKECLIDDNDLWSSEDDDDNYGEEISYDGSDCGDKTDDGEIKKENPLKINLKKETTECSCSCLNEGSHETGCGAITHDTYCFSKPEQNEDTSKPYNHMEVTVELEQEESITRKTPNKRIKLCNDERKLDAFDAFGKSVAMQLKTLTEDSALMAQTRIQATLSECGMADFKNKRLNRTKNIKKERRKSDSDDDLNGTSNWDSVPRSYYKYKLSNK